MENTQLKCSNKFAWILVVALGLMSAGTTGSYSVVAGCFMVPVCESLDLDYTLFSYYFTGTLLGVAVGMPFAGKYLPKLIGKPGLPIISVILLVAGACMAFYTQAWQFWISSVIIGICMGFTTGVCMSTVVDQWFVKKAGLAIGLAWTINSIYMLIMSPAITAVIEAVGWRMSYLILATVSAILVLPSVILIIRYCPADKNMLPYGYEPDVKVTGTQSFAKVSGVSFKSALRAPAFWLCVMFLSLVQLTVCMNQLFPTFAAEVGFDPMIGGLMVSAASFADIFFNIFVGSSCDKFGTKHALLFWIGLCIVSFILLIIGSTNSTVAIAGAAVNDVMYVVAGAGLTCLIIELFGSKDFGQIFAWICTIAYIVGAFGMPFMTTIYSAAGSFVAVFGVCIGIDILIGALLLLAYKFSKNLKWENENGSLAANSVSTVQSIE
ncbi:MFS transporter [Slackia exigua]|uniref:MFS transporter n=1 Tax=Slackia exigua TaxID=84109 RepID=UPI002006B73B|nr:MFS transporter [Slackia exigua]MCK6139146.1 MFS transporter [Slackia exigua]